MNEVNKEKLDEYEKALTAQRHQQDSMSRQVGKLQVGMKQLSTLNEANIENLDSLLEIAESMLDKDINLSMNDLETSGAQITLSDEELSNITMPDFGVIKAIELADDTEWQMYMQNVEKYISANNIVMKENSIQDLLTDFDNQNIAKRLNEDYKMEKANCDKYDYLIAGFCGVATGIIDSIFVGMPGDSKLGKWTDKKTDDFVMKVSQSIWKNDKRGGGSGKPNNMPDTLKKSIGYLEQRFQVNYDARYASDLIVKEDQLKGMRPSNHHLKSLAHSPSIIGLVFSILDQFTGNASFIDQGKLIRVGTKKENFRLEGNSFLSKLACGIFNWIGHLLSDVVGSSSTRDTEREKTGRGSGLGIPFYELLQLCEFGSFNESDEKLNLAQLSVKVFERGYDFRHGITMAIPVAINEISIRMLWAVKQRYYHNKHWNECIPFGRQPELRRMLLVGHGALCIVDGLDATLKSGGYIINFALSLNIMAWSRFAFSGLIEVRALYKENAIDLTSLENDLALEWEKIIAQEICGCSSGVVENYENS